MNAVSSPRLPSIEVVAVAAERAVGAVVPASVSSPWPPSIVICVVTACGAAALIGRCRRGR